MSILIKNAMVVTMNPARDILTEAMVAVEGNRITFVDKMGRNLERDMQPEIVIDAKGKVVFPGFINLHTHTFLAVLRGWVEEGPSVHHAIYNMMVPASEYPTEDEVYTLGMLGTLDCLKAGCTTIVENSTKMHIIAEAIRESGIRGILAAGRIHDVDVTKVKDNIYELDDKIRERSLNNALKLIEDWHLKENGRIRCLLYPHAVDTVSVPLFKQIRELTKHYGIGVTTHASQSTNEVKKIKEQYGKSPVQHLADVGFLGKDCTLAHAIFLEEDDISILAETETNIAHNAACNARRGYVAPVPQMRAAGVNVGLGTDNMLGDMIKNMRTALVMSRLLAGKPDDPKPLDVLEMATLKGAKALGMEQELGSIEVGKLADLVIVDYQNSHLHPLFPENIVGNLVHCGVATDVDIVIVDGKVVVEQGIIKTVDEAAVVKESQNAAVSLLERIDVLTN